MALATPPTSLHHLPSPEAAPVVQPAYSFEGNDTVTVLDVHLPGVRRSDITLRLQGQQLLIGGRCARGASLLQPSVRYVLRVQLAAVDRKAVTAAMRGFDTLRVRIPALAKREV